MVLRQSANRPDTLMESVHNQYAYTSDLISFILLRTGWLRLTDWLTGAGSSKRKQRNNAHENLCGNRLLLLFYRKKNTINAMIFVLQTNETHIRDVFNVIRYWKWEMDTKWKWMVAWEITNTINSCFIFFSPFFFFFIFYFFEMYWVSWVNRLCIEIRLSNGILCRSDRAPPQAWNMKINNSGIIRLRNDISSEYHLRPIK